MAHQQRVAVGLRLGGFGGAERAAGARLVVDDDGLAERHSELRCDRARQDVSAAAGRERHDEAHRSHSLRAHNERHGQQASEQDSTGRIC
ncbi:MAG: hypothetical protein ACHP83_09610 [Burkholderiales bacterium]